MRDAGAPDKLVLIAGPTASGKSALALALAQRMGATIVNADAMQVYRDLRIITARPTPAEERRVPHRLYGHLDAAESYSVGRWLIDAGGVLAELTRAGRAAIVVGGTGLYFKALAQGLSAVPPIPSNIRAAARARLQAEGPAALHAELAERDPASAARLRSGDGVRIVRALEVIEATGRSLADWHRDGMQPLIDPARTVRLFLDVPRGELYARIDRRFAKMLEAGALEEVRALAARGLDPLLPVMKAHGVPWLRRHLAGEITLAQAAEEGARDTRHYAKRQATWFRHQLSDWPWVAPDDAERFVCDALGVTR